MSADVSSDALGWQHPLALELASLQQAVAHYQLEAHKATLQLQHQSHQSRVASQHARALENEVAALKSELSVHRAHSISDDNPQQAALQVQELTLALRRLSDKLDLTEQNLVNCREELVKTRAERDAAKHIENSALNFSTQLRHELEISHAENRELANRAKMAEEERKMSDLVVEEYASLVRTMEGRSSRVSSSSSPAPNGHTIDGQLDGLNKARAGLQTLLQESNDATEKLHSEMAQLHELLEKLQLKQTAQGETAADYAQKLAQAQVELMKLENDDNAAAKMVSRYMKFSQSSTDVLHRTIENLKKRHMSSVGVYDRQVQHLEELLATEKRQTERLLLVLDELSEDISREVYGRRREVSLRLALLTKEELFSERLKRWILRAEEKLVRGGLSDGERQASFEDMLASAHSILRTMNAESDDSLSSLARIIAADAAVATLRKELQLETDKRLLLENRLTALQDAAPKQSVLFKEEGNDKHRLLRLSLLRSFMNGTVVPRSFKEATVQVETTISANALAPDSMSTDIAETKTSAATTTSVDEVLSDAARVAEGKDDASCIPDVLVTEPSFDDIATSTPSERSISADVILTMEDTLATNREQDPVHAIGNDVADTAATDITSTQITDDPQSTARPDTDPVRELQHTGSESVPPELLIIEPRDSLLLVKFPQEDRFKTEQITNSMLPPALPLSFHTPDVSNSFLAPELALLLPKLDTTEHRYDDMQRQFNNCSISLQEMKSTLSDFAEKPNYLPAVLDRLHDYCEDARVELEIRISDEERIIKGYQTLLSVPGALSDEVDEVETRRDIEAFIDGSDPAVHRAQDMLQRKLEDLQHDIASIKQAAHEYQLSPNQEVTNEILGETSRPEPSSWASWTGSFLSSSRSPSPAPSFGAVMTSPRLRHSSSSQRIRRDSHTNSQSPYAALGLRIPMPAAVVAPPSPPGAASRPRVISNAFNVGIRGGLAQARTSSFSLNRPSRPSVQINNLGAATDFSYDVE